ncbi:MAG: carboxymuconolactone decarboxylase family protein [Leptospirillia bacterium]
MSDHLHEVDLLIENLRKNYPSEINSFLTFKAKAEAGPALSKREKELINVGLSVAAQCSWCISLHVKGALDAGATRDEIMEAGFMAVVMHGGPALMYLIELTRELDSQGNTTTKAPGHS